jgi:hypothetical protein
MSETHFMNKPLSYWVKLEETFGDVRDDPYLLLVAAEAKSAALESRYENDKLAIEKQINTLRKQLGLIDGE